MNGTKLSDKLREVERRLRTEKSRRMFERYQAVRLHLMGRSCAEIAVGIGRNERTVGEYIRKYRADGLNGLDMRRSPGPPERLTDEQRARLACDVAERSPADVGIADMPRWTLRAVRDYIRREFGIDYSIRGVSKLLRRIGVKI